MKEKEFDNLLKAAGEAFEFLKKDLGKTKDDVVKAAKSTCNEVKKTAEDMFKEILDSPFNDGKVSIYNTGKQFLVTILTTNDFVRESLTVKVSKEDLLLKVNFISQSYKENVKYQEKALNFKETSSFEISVPSDCDFDKGVKASIKEGFIMIAFEIKEKETDTVKVDIE